MEGFTTRETGINTKFTASVGFTKRFRHLGMRTEDALKDLICLDFSTQLELTNKTFRKDFFSEWIIE